MIGENVTLERNVLEESMRHLALVLKSHEANIVKVLVSLLD